MVVITRACRRASWGVFVQRGFCVVLSMAVVLSAAFMLFTPQSHLQEMKDEQNLQTSALIPKNAERTQVLLFTYMRGGSSLFGEIFNRNTEASYWFEPLDGLYSALYGHSPGWNPLDIILRTNGHKRDIPEFERDAILNELSRILHCNISALAQHVKISYAMTRLGKSHNESYVECLRQAAVDFVKHNPTESYYNETSKCLVFLMTMCWTSFDDSSVHQDACHRNLTLAHTHSPNVLPEFKNYLSCMRKMAQYSARCLPHLSSVCVSASLVAIKVIRLQASLVASLLKQNPQLKVIHLLRDPRGIIISRQNAQLISLMADNNETTEARHLCDRMASDIRVFQDLQAAFPGRVIPVKYEDLTQRPLPVVNRVYEFLGRETPPNVLDWFKNSMSGSSDSGVHGTMRMSSEQTAFKWRDFLREPLRSTINEMCASVIEHLDQLQFFSTAD